MASAIRLLACVLTTPLALALECLELGSKCGNTVTKSHTKGSVLITDCVHGCATLFLYHHCVCK